MTAVWHKIKKKWLLYDKNRKEMTLALHKDENIVVCNIQNRKLFPTASNKAHILCTSIQLLRNALQGNMYSTSKTDFSLDSYKAKWQTGVEREEREKEALIATDTENRDALTTANDKMFVISLVIFFLLLLSCDTFNAAEITGKCQNYAEPTTAPRSTLTCLSVTTEEFRKSHLAYLAPSLLRSEPNVSSSVPAQYISFCTLPGTSAQLKPGQIRDIRNQMKS